MGISRREVTKDALQQSAEATTSAASSVSTIIFGAARQVITEVGGLATDLFEIRDASRRAHHDDDNDPGH